MTVVEQGTERIEIMATPDTPALPRRPAASMNEDAAADMAADRLPIRLDAGRWRAFGKALSRPVADKPRLRRLLTEKSVLE